MIIRLVAGLCLFMAFPITILACEFDDVQCEKVSKQLQENRHVLDKGALEDPEVVKRHLTVMCGLDQEVRQLFMECDSPTIREILTEVDCFHTNHLKKILALYGWITISKFGEEADHQTWLLVQHADHDPEFQEKCLATLEQLLPLQETNKEHYAYLYDRAALKSEKFGLRQRYGTQAVLMNGELELSPYEGSLDDLKRRRQEMRLEPLEDYMKHLKELYTK